MWIYITHVTGLNIFKIKIQDLAKVFKNYSIFLSSWQDIEDVKRWDSCCFFVRCQNASDYPFSANFLPKI